MVKKGLGKGLGALIPSGLSENFHEKTSENEILQIPLHKIKSNPNQPRKEFNEDKIAELAQSIKENGLIQPIIVRKDKNNYQIIAGERRFRAYSALQLTEIPAILKDFDDEKTSRVSLIENIQRQDLNPVEEAQAYDRLIKEHGLKQGELGDILGKSRSTITNSLRLLELPKEILTMVKEERIFMGHARALLALPDEKTIKETAREVEKKALSVRQTEDLIRKILENKKTKEIFKVENVELKRIKENLQLSLGTKVDIKGTDKKGKIEIEYYSLEDLNRILDILEPK